MGDLPNRNLLYELKESFSKMDHQGLEDVLQNWEHIYGINSEDSYVKELITDLKKSFEECWKQQLYKLEEIKEEYFKRIHEAGNEASILEKALGLEEQVHKVPGDIPLVQIEESMLSLLESYQDMKNERLKEYFQLQEKEKELCSVLNIKTPKYKLETPPDTNMHGNFHGHHCYIPTSDDMTEFKERVRELEQLKEQLEYDFEDTKAQLCQLLEECNILPLTIEERFAFDLEELPVTNMNLTLMMGSVKNFKRQKEEMMAEAAHLRDQIERLSTKMFKDHDEIVEFLSVCNGFTEPTIKRLKDKLKELKEERKHNLKELVAKSREALSELWDKCCYSQDQRKGFPAYLTKHLTEEVLDIHDLEIENLKRFYNRYKKIFTLAKQHEELWERMLQLEDQANNKDRLFTNRGGCLLKEEKERKVIQKKVPAIKSELIDLLNAYKDETGSDFLHFGEPLLDKIIEKEQQREDFKRQERELRKTANAENVMIESRLGARPITGIKRKAGMTPQNPNRIKSMKTETTTISSASSKSTLSSKSTASSACPGTLVNKEVDKGQGRTHLTVPVVNYMMQTPSRSRMPAASTPQNGSLSYESFQEHIEKSKHLAHNSTRNAEQQRVLRARNLNQTRTVIEKTTPYHTPKTPGKTFTKTPSKTPSRIPFRIPTGSKIPSQVPPVSPRKPVLSKTKLPIIF